MEPFPKIPQAVVLEHEIALMMSQQKVTGWPFDVKKAQQLAKLRYRLGKIN